MHKQTGTIFQLTGSLLLDGGGAEEDAIAEALQTTDCVFLKEGNQHDYLDTWLDTPLKQEIRSVGWWFRRDGI